MKAQQSIDTESGANSVRRALQGAIQADSVSGANLDEIDDHEG